MLNYNRLNTLLGWLAFLIAAVVYTLTLEPTTSFWDCGEFISASYKLLVGHPPGAPFFMLMGRFFTLFAGDPSNVAFTVNFMSGLASAFTIAFLFWTITHLARKIFMEQGKEEGWRIWAVMAAGMIGALAYTFSDTFWFSAVEGEVYAMSSLFTAVVFWAILKWENVANEPHSNRWLILIAYLMGLSIGVHLLNLLAIPAIAMVYYYKKYEVTPRNTVKALALSFLILGVILYGIIPGVVKVASWFELLFVNGWGLPFNSGVAVYALLLVGGLIYGIYYTYVNNKPVMNTIFTGIAVIILGYSSFSLIVIRSVANPTMDQNSPEDVFSLMGYLNREQYGDRPLFSGQYYNSPLDWEAIDRDKGRPVYVKRDKRYEIVDYRPAYKFDETTTTLFPRMYSRDDRHIEEYQRWGNIRGRRVSVSDQNGRPQQILLPTFVENLRFFFNYQVRHMYFRYFMWNFAGRQNDIQGHGEVHKGNWISGIPFIDNWMYGDQELLPDSLKNNPARNKYYLLPLLLGILGLAFQSGAGTKGKRDFWVVMLLFFFTGLAIVLYLNQSPLQPRERDYAFAGSFYAFAIWVGFGVLAISDFIKKKANHRTAAIAATAIGLLAAPVLMASQNWDDHNRSNKTTARDLAINYLESCAPNAILFTYGDNDTYPLWYAQEVENIRPDVRVVNLRLLSADWYVRQMKGKVNEAEALPITMENNQFVQGTRDFIRYSDYSIQGNIELANILSILLSDNPQDQQQMQDGSRSNFLPTKNFKLTVNKEAVINNKVVPQGWQDQIVDSMVWNYNKDYVSKAELAILDILVHNNWKRPIYFARTVPSDNYLGLDNYLVTEGFAYRLMPIAASIQTDPNQQTERINTDAMYDNTMNKFVWGNIKNENYLDPESYGMLNLIMNNFNSLSNALVEEGKMDQAKEVMKRSLEVVPDKIYSIRETLQKQSMAESLYKVGDIENANRVVTNTTDYLEQNLNYFFNIAESKPNLEMNNMQLGMYILHAMDQLTADYQQTKENERIKKIFEEFEQRYSSSGSN